MNRRILYGSMGIAALLAVGLVVFYKFDPAASAGQHRAAAVADRASGAPMSEGPVPASHATTKPSAVGADDHDPLPVQLQNANDADWIAVYPQLMGLSAIELWNLLDRPELRGHPRAKWLTRGVLIGCVAALDELDANLSDAERRSAPTARAWCASLANVPRDIRSARLLALGADPDLQAMGLRLPPLSLLDDAGEQSALMERSQEVLALSKDITMLPRAIENLLFGERSSLTQQLPAWDQLPRPQRQLIAAALQAVVTCEAVAACGPQSFLTYRLCSSSNLFDCQQGAGMLQTVHTSLSPSQLRIFNELMARARGIRSRPGDV